ncbi:flagellar basal body rod protein [Alkalicoccus urumqiensis]|uniref:Flagellar basal body rod protein n=1 Tax=Alkalicoccus urumqiensis TaxID=1548213 RepID=A0A2P6MF33_ALKUR|nr:flagellar basal body rod protein [Alkalicoccus urumqiensis]PRO64912.1 flagellar basal body rod protein [Alkalicoccus urumqiensis]
MKVVILLAAVIAGLIVLSQLGPMLLFVLGAWLLYVSYTRFQESRSTGAKAAWVVLAVITITLMLGTSSALIGLAALYFLYVVYRSWNRKGEFHYE